MKLLVVLFCFTCLAACSATDQLTDITLPTLVEQYPLPPVPQEMLGPQTQLDFELLIGKEGSVLETRLIKGSGNIMWDSAAVVSMHKWRYTPAYYKDKPLKIWLHQTAIVRFVETRCMSLEEISCGSMADADSAYKMLAGGADFAAVARKFSLSKSKENDGKLGSVNILSYPQDIRDALEMLRPGEYSKPLQYNDRYIIFKRLKQ